MNPTPSKSREPRENRRRRYNATRVKIAPRGMPENATRRPREPYVPESAPHTEGTNDTRNADGVPAAPRDRRGRGKRESFTKRSRDRKRRSVNPPLKHRLTEDHQRGPKVPEITDPRTVRVIPISGVEEIGRNMTVVETPEDIIIFDAGLQFVSEESDAPGVNYILPNTQYLEERKHKIRGMVVTHGHLDHIGGIPFIMERIGNPPIYTQYLTSLMILKRQEEFPHLPAIDMHIVKEGESFTLGTLKVKTFGVTHSIPDSMGVSVETSQGNIVITGDIKLDHVDGKPSPDEVRVWGGIGKDNNLMLIADSTNAEKEGFSAPEAGVNKNIE